MERRTPQAALHAIHRATAAPWTVAKLAAEAKLSRAPFARRFAAMIGQPSLTYLTWWRMTMAARLLRTSDAPLKSIAAQVGYTSEFAFSHAFKRTYGEAPAHTGGGVQSDDGALGTFIGSVAELVTLRRLDRSHGCAFLGACSRSCRIWQAWWSRQWTKA